MRELIDFFCKTTFKVTFFELGETRFTTTQSRFLFWYDPITIIFQCTDEYGRILSNSIVLKKKEFKKIIRSSKYKLIKKSEYHQV